MQVNFDKAGCKPFFKKVRGRQRAIQEKIVTAVSEQVTTGMGKTKLAVNDRIEGQSIHEFRLNIGPMGSVRVAFFTDNRMATVLFISTDLQKSSFTGDLERFLKGRL